MALISISTAIDEINVAIDASMSISVAIDGVDVDIDDIGVTIDNNEKRSIIYASAGKLYQFELVELTN